MIRDVTGLNEARDGSTPDARALVGVQKIAAANSNTATRHILDGSLFLTSDLAENLSLRISDILEYSPTKEAFIQKIGNQNVAVLEEMKDLYLHDFAIFIELQPDEEEKAVLENNIQAAISSGLIDIDDAIDLREIRSTRLANQLLKIRRKAKQERDMQMQQQNIQAQADANAQAQQIAAEAEVMKNQAITAQKAELLRVQAAIDKEKMMQEVASKKELMHLEFKMNLKLKEAESSGKRSEEVLRENRKDDRSRMEATQQGEIKYRSQTNQVPKNFESAGNDVIGGGFNLDSTDPR